MACNPEIPLCTGYVKLDCCNQPIWDTFTVEDMSYNQEWLYVEIPCSEVPTTTTTTTPPPTTTTTTTTTTAPKCCDLTVINNSVYNNISYQLDLIGDGTKVNGTIDSDETQTTRYCFDPSVTQLTFKAQSFNLEVMYISVTMQQPGTTSQVQTFPAGTVSFEFDGNAHVTPCLTTIIIESIAPPTTTTTTTIAPPTTTTTTTTTTIGPDKIDLKVINNTPYPITFTNWQYGIAQSNIVTGVEPFPTRYPVDASSSRTFPLGTTWVNSAFTVIHDGYPRTYLRFEGMSNVAGVPISMVMLYTPAGGSPTAVHVEPLIYAMPATFMINGITPESNTGLTDLVEVYLDNYEGTTTSTSTATTTAPPHTLRITVINATAACIKTNFLAYTTVGPAPTYPLIPGPNPNLPIGSSTLLYNGPVLSNATGTIFRNNAVYTTCLYNVRYEYSPDNVTYTTVQTLWLQAGGGNNINLVTFNHSLSSTTHYIRITYLSGEGAWCNC